MRLPTIGQLAREGAFAAPPEGALSVLPSVTYPSHTTLVTGVYPGSHGITTNLVLASDDDTDLGEWRWYRKDIRVATLYDVALDGQLRTALMHWPVTVGARATALIPEFRDRGEKMSPSVLRSLSTARLSRESSQSPVQTSMEKQNSDSEVIDAAITALDTVHPNLMFIHIAQTDSAEHKYGPDSPEAEECAHPCRPTGRTLAGCAARFDDLGTHGASDRVRSRLCVDHAAGVAARPAHRGWPRGARGHERGWWSCVLLPALA